MRVVVLHGKEHHLRSLYTQQLREALEEEHGDVERIRFNGSAALADVLDECRSFGLMQQHKLVVVDEADQLVNAETRPSLERYAKAPSENATLLLRADTWRPGNLDKAIKACGAVIKCEALTPGDAAAWVQRAAEKRHAVAIEPDAVTALLERVGTDLGRIDAELAKLSAMAHETGRITAALVRESVGLTREEEVWAIQSHLVLGDPERAIRAVREALGPSRQPEALVSFAIMDLARKLHAASRMIRAGSAPQRAAGQLKIWGDSRDAILKAAEKADPEALAVLFDDAVEADARFKTGRADPALSLETLALRFASLGA